MEYLKAITLALVGTLAIHEHLLAQQAEAQATAVDHKIGQCFDKHFDGRNLNVQSFQGCVKS